MQRVAAEGQGNTCKNFEGETQEAPGRNSSSSWWRQEEQQTCVAVKLL